MAINEFCDDCKTQYCFLMELIEHDRKYNRRLVMQMKMVEIFKLLESKRQNKDIGWQGAMAEWASGGMAKKFADVFDEKLSVKEMKKRLFE
jgi:hypothetical protein